MRLPGRRFRSRGLEGTLAPLSHLHGALEASLAARPAGRDGHLPEQRWQLGSAGKTAFVCRAAGEGMGCPPR